MLYIIDILLLLIDTPTITYEYNWETHVRLLHLINNKYDLYSFMKIAERERRQHRGNYS